MEKFKRKSNLWIFLSKRRALALLMLIAACVILFSILYPANFGSLDNYASILLNMSGESLIIIAMAMILMLGEIDLSLGAVMVFGGVLCGRLMIQSGASIIVSILIPIAIALLLGLINGFISTKLRIVSFITTLATSMIYLGISIILSGTGWTNFPDPVFTFLGKEQFLGLQLPVYYMIIFFVLFGFLLHKTRYFRQLYYIGGNAKSAELSGINVHRTKIVIFMLASALACLQGIFSAMRFNSALTNVGTGVELRAVTACVIGGVSFTGGTGTISGAAAGGLFIALLKNILTMVQLSPDLQFTITGIILILAIVADIFVAKKAA